jgi:hypothetical protein
LLRWSGSWFLFPLESSNGVTILRHLYMALSAAWSEFVPLEVSLDDDTANAQAQATI